MTQLKQQEKVLGCSGKGGGAIRPGREEVSWQGGGGLPKGCWAGLCASRSRALFIQTFWSAYTWPWIGSSRRDCFN